MIGERFGRLTVLAEGPRAESTRKQRRWICRCDCGNERLVYVESLRRGLSKSCGCLSRETSAAILRARATHGHTRGGGGKRTPTYGSWRAMVYRCTSPSDSSYWRYGAVGVTVCDRWRHSFENFLADMGERPAGMTLDRIDGAKGYELSNCRWATTKQQLANRKSVRLIEFGGRSMNITEWARELGISAQSIRARLEGGWPIEKALTAPRSNTGPRIP